MVGPCQMPPTPPTPSSRSPGFAPAASSIAIIGVGSSPYRFSDPLVVLVVEAAERRLRYRRQTESPTVEHLSAVGSHECFEVERPGSRSTTAGLLEHFPHVCPRCAAPAYVGLLRVECSGVGCPTG